MKEQIDAFYDRLQTQSDALITEGLFKELDNLILEKDLKNIYAYLLNDKCRNSIFDNLNECVPNQFSKKDTGLSRTFDIVFHPISKEIQLILETKSKMVNQQGVTEKTAIAIEHDRNKTIKPAWRIDTPKPIKMANSVSYIFVDKNKDDYLRNFYNSSTVATYVVNKVGLQAAKYLQLITPGKAIYKNGTRAFEVNNQRQPYFAKQSYYCKYPRSDLGTFISELYQYNTVSEYFYQKITFDLLTGMNYLHQADIIHQDISLNSMLVYEDENNDFTITLSNFDNSVDPIEALTSQPLANRPYASPEILAFFADKNNKSCSLYPLYKFYHKNDDWYYGKDIYKKSQDQTYPYQTSDKANDAWALGVLLHEVYKNKKPHSGSDFGNNLIISGFLASNRENRLTIENALQLFQSRPLPLVQNSLRDKIQDFFARIENKFGLPKALENLVTEQQINAIYDYFKNPAHQTFLLKHLSMGMPYHLHKSITGLARTLNLVFEPISHDIQLILETKTKAINRYGKTYKTRAQPRTGTNKTVKPAWRIDTPTPIKMANAVFYARENESTAYELEEARIAASLATHVVRQGGAGVEKFINVTAIGAERYKTGIRGRETYYAKQSYYSEYAIGDLDSILSNQYNPLTTELCDYMMHDLLLGEKYIQKAGVIHQDLKTKNILVYPGDKSKYNLRICDFDAAYHPDFMSDSRPSATIKYESPEISALYAMADEFKKILYNYFHENFCFESYGKKIYHKNRATLSVEELKAYEYPHNANDMWALGIVAHQLYHQNKHPSVYNNLLQNSYLGGLIDPNRQTRLTIEKVLDLFYAAHPEIKKDNSLELTTPTQSFLPGFNQKNNSNSLLPLNNNLASMTLSSKTPSL